MKTQIALILVLLSLGCVTAPPAPPPHVTEAAPTTFDLPQTPTKLQNGINITTEDWGAMIYPDYTLHYYVLRIPSRNLSVNLTSASVQTLLGTAQIDQILLYPITAERPYSVSRQRLGGTRGNLTNITTTENRVEYTTGAATNQLRTAASRNYIVEARTANFMEGAWGSAALGFDPNVTACGTLATAGATYTMNQSITAGSADCINFGNQNITLDCQGYSLKGVGGFTYYGIFTNRTNSTILNCNISNFGIAVGFNGMNSFFNNSNITESTLGSGLVLTGADNSRLSFLNFTGDAAYNIQADANNVNFTNITVRAHGTYTPIIATGKDIWFRNLSIYNSSFGIYWQGMTGGGVDTCYQETGSYGFSLFDAHYVSITNCWTNVSTAYSSGYPAEAGWWGAYYSQSYPINWTNTTVYSEQTNFLLSEFALDTTMQNVTLITTGNRAIDIGTDGSAYIYNSRLIAAAETYYNSGTEAGTITNSYVAATTDRAARTTSATFNTFINNTFESNGSVVFDMEEYTIINQLINNTFKSRNATLIESHSTTYSNLIYWNNFTNTTGLYINDSGGNYYNTTINGRAEGNIWANVMNGSVAITGTNLSSYGGGLYIGAGANVPYNNSTSLGKFLCSASGCGDMGPLTPTQTALNTCTPPGSGNWTLNCADNCNLSNSVLSIDYILYNGTGTVRFNNVNITYKGQKPVLPASCTFNWVRHIIRRLG